MSDTPEGNICKVSANLGWASDTLAEVDKALLKLSAEIKTILRERDNFQDQRDFAMGEIERLRKERDEARGKYPEGNPYGATYHINKCDICGEVREVTEPRDFGHLKEGWDK